MYMCIHVYVCVCVCTRRAQQVVQCANNKIASCMSAVHDLPSSENFVFVEFMCIRPEMFLRDAMVTRSFNAQSASKSNDAESVIHR